MTSQRTLTHLGWTLTITIHRNYAEFHYDKCRILFNVLLTAVMLSVKAPGILIAQKLKQLRLCNYVKFHYDECRILFHVLMNFVMLGVILLSVE